MPRHAKRKRTIVLRKPEIAAAGAAVGRWTGDEYEIKYVPWQDANKRLIVWSGDWEYDAFTLEDNVESSPPPPRHEDGPATSNKKPRGSRGLLKKQNNKKNIPVAAVVVEERDSVYREEHNVAAKCWIYKLMLEPTSLRVAPLLEEKTAKRVLCLDGPSLRFTKLVAALGVPPNRVDVPQQDPRHYSMMVHHLAELSRTEEEEEEDRQSGATSASPSEQTPERGRGGKDRDFDPRTLSGVNLFQGSLHAMLTPMAAPADHHLYSLIFLDYCSSFNENVRSDLRVLFSKPLVAHNAVLGITSSERRSELQTLNGNKSCFHEHSLISSMIETDTVQIARSHGYILQLIGRRSYGFGNRMQFHAFHVERLADIVLA